MTIRQLAVAVLLLTPVPAFALAWVHAHDTLADAPRAVVAMRDQGFVIADGKAITRENASGEVLWSTKLSSNGTICFAAAGPGDDLFAGGTTNMEHGAAGWIARLNGDGQPVWSRRYTSDESMMIMFRAAASMPDGGVAVCGLADNDGIVVRFAPDGSIKWQARFEMSGQGWLSSIAALPDGKVIVGGHGDPAALVAELDTNGAMVWHRTLGTNGARVMAISATRDGIVAGGTKGLLAKFARDGGIQWERRLQGDAEDTIYDVAELSGGALLATAITTSQPAKSALLVMALSPAGEVLWQRLHGVVSEEIVASDLNGRNAIATRDGGAIVAVSGNQLRVFRFDADGHAGSDCAVMVDVHVPLAAATVAYAPIDAALMPMHLSPADEPLHPDALQQRTRAFCEPEQQRLLEAAVHSNQPSAPPAATAEEKETFRQQIAELVLAKRFDQLDAKGEQLRSTHAMFGPFEAKLEVFYDAVASSGIDAAVGPEQHLVLLDEWRKSKPDSPTAIVALAHTLTQQAGRARGSGFADTVTERGAETYTRLLKRAGTVLDEGKAVAASDPNYWVDRIYVDHGRGREWIEQSGTAGDWYPMLFFAAMSYELPQWGGTPHDYMELTEQAVRHTRATYGDGMYARFAWKLVRLGINSGHESLLQQYGFSPARIKSAYEALIERFPGYIANYHELAHMAYWMNDRQLARAMFARPELAWSRDAQRCWSDREDYERVREWATEPTVVPASPLR